MYVDEDLGVDGDIYMPKTDYGARNAPEYYACGVVTR